MNESMNECINGGTDEREKTKPTNLQQILSVSGGQSFRHKTLLIC